MLAAFGYFLGCFTVSNQDGKSRFQWNMVYHQVLAGSLFFRWMISDISRLCIHIHWYCLYIWLYVHPIQFIGHPYQLVVWLVVCNPTNLRGLPGCHDRQVALSVDSACESSRANEIYHGLGGGIIWLTSLKIMFLVWAMKFWAPGCMLGICWGWNM